MINLKLDASSGLLLQTATFGGYTVTASNAMDTGVWRFITATYVNTDPSFGDYGSNIFLTQNYVDQTVVYAGTPHPVGTLSFSPSDFVRLGGFLGQISDFRVYTPGSFALNNRKIIT